MRTKQLNIKNRTYYFYNDLINVLNFEASNLKLNKKTWKDIDIYYIGYVDKDKPSDWKVNSVNPLYLIINRIHGMIVENNDFKFLSIDKGDAVLKKHDIFWCFLELNTTLKKLMMVKAIKVPTMTKLSFEVTIYFI